MSILYQNPNLSEYSDTESGIENDIESDIESDNDFYNRIPKHCLGISILWSQYLHGLSNNSSPNINTYWIVEECISINDFYENNLHWINNYRRYVRTLLSSVNNLHNRILYNPKINIIYMDYLPGDECVACIKTIWIRLIQLRWKKLFKLRKVIIKQRTYPKSLLYRETFGKWPNHLNNLPNIRNIINF